MDLWLPSLYLTGISYTVCPAILYEYCGFKVAKLEIYSHKRWWSISCWPSFIARITLCLVPVRHTLPIECSAPDREYAPNREYISVPNWDINSRSSVWMLRPFSKLKCARISEFPHPRDFFIWKKTTWGKFLSYIFQFPCIVWVLWHAKSNLPAYLTK